MAAILQMTVSPPPNPSPGKRFNPLLWILLPSFPYCWDDTVLLLHCSSGASCMSKTQNRSRV